MLFDPGTSKFFVLNPSMAFAWRQCDGSHSFSQIAKKMSESFSDADFETVSYDLKKAIEEMLNLELLIEATAQA